MSLWSQLQKHLQNLFQQRLDTKVSTPRKEPKFGGSVDSGRVWVKTILHMVHSLAHLLNLFFQVRTLFVSGLPLDIKPRELYLLFRPFKVPFLYFKTLLKEAKRLDVSDFIKAL